MGTRKRKRRGGDLPEKANKILNGILVVLILVGIKVWHLAVIQHDKKQEEAKKPQRRIVLEKSERANIYDRFNIPLASNKVQYNAAVSYAPIRELPRSSWKKNEEGKRVKFFLRKEYITLLSKKLGDELQLDPDWVEDLIHSKAAILGNVPCILRENISEEQYFKLKMLEKDWPGIVAEIGAKRCYPLGPISGEIIGYIGPISRREFDGITKELASLREVLNNYEEGEGEVNILGYSSVEEAAHRLEELEKKAYRINDFVGKAGIEATFDEALRGSCGKHIYLSDTHGNFLQELPGSHDPVPGTRLVLTLSAELQSYALQLLAEYDSEGFSEATAAVKRRTYIPENQPWIKGGAIVAMDPNTGDVYAMASFPTFDPNDFIRAGSRTEVAEKNFRVQRWLETEDYLAHVWDMKIPYSRQRYENDYYEENLELGWEEYLRFVLPKKSSLRTLFENKGTLADALFLQLKFQQLLSLFHEETLAIEPAKIIDFAYREDPSVQPIGSILTLHEKVFLEERWQQVKEKACELQWEIADFFSVLPLNYEKLLLVDLYRLVVDAEKFSPTLGEVLGTMSLHDYKDASARYVSVDAALKALVKDLFLENDFKLWRELNFKEYLARCRKAEKEAGKKYARPYIEYLEHVRKELFDAFWETYRWDLLTLFVTGKFFRKNRSDEEIALLKPYLSGLKHWESELQAGAHQGLDWVGHYHKLRRVTDELDSQILIEFLQTLRSFNDLDAPLFGKYSGLRGTKIKHLAAAFYPTYGFGFARSHAFRQAATVGSIFKIVPAYEALKQRYLALKEQGAALFDLNPLTIVDDKHRIWGKTEGWNVGFTAEGRPIPLFYRGGRLPRSEHAGIGKVDLLRALETSSNPYFAMLAGDVLEDPEDLCIAANLLGFGEKTAIDLPGEYAGRIPIDVAYNRTGLYSLSIGQHSLVGTPLQTAVMLSAIANGGAVLKPQIVKTQVIETNVLETEPATRWRVFMPPQIQSMLLTGMRQVVLGDKGTARGLKQQYDHRLVRQIIGKTSTAEVIERMSLDGKDGRMKLKHVWFGGIAYESNDFSKPELVVIVYLRYGEWGRDAAPLALEIVKKWREIKNKQKYLVQGN